MKKTAKTKRTKVTQLVITSGAGWRVYEAYGFCDNKPFNAHYRHMLNCGPRDAWVTDTHGFTDTQKRMIGRAISKAERDGSAVVIRREANLDNQ